MIHIIVFLTIIKITRLSQNKLILWLSRLSRSVGTLNQSITINITITTQIQTI